MNLNKNIKAKTHNIKVKWAQEMSDDLKNQFGFLEKEKQTTQDMLHYEYIAKDEKEIDLIKELTEIDFEDGNHFVYSMSKKQLRKIKLGAIEGIREYNRMKKIIFYSELIQDVSRILEMKLSKEIGTSIDREILKDIHNFNSK